MKDIVTEKHISEDGLRYATAEGCPYRCYQTTREGMALDICPQYAIAADGEKTKECCKDDEC